jgi:hypothetical protein
MRKDTDTDCASADRTICSSNSRSALEGDTSWSTRCCANFDQKPSRRTNGSTREPVRAVNDWSGMDLHPPSARVRSSRRPRIAQSLVAADEKCGPQAIRVLRAIGFKTLPRTALVLS